MKHLLRRAALLAEDRVRYSPRSRAAMCRYALWRARHPGPGRGGEDNPEAEARRVQRLCGAVRLATEAALLRRIERDIAPCVARLDPARVDLGRFVSGIDERRLTKAVVLKPYVGPDEKGVIFVSFEGQWARLLRGVDLAGFARRYALVVAPSWSPPHSLISYLFPRAYPDPVFTLISNPRDLDTFPRISSRYVPVPLYASHWVLPSLFRPLPYARRDVDLVMVANWGKFKRHHALFAALRRMPGDVRVLLIGQDQDGRTGDTIRAEARAYGVAGRVTVLCNAPYADVAGALCRSKVSVVLSRREGSCVVVAESLFAGTPVGLLEDAEIGSRSFVNEETGRLLRGDRDLAAQLTAFLAESSRYAPRAWAERHISCWESSRVLNDAVRARHLADGGAWTMDLAPLCWRPDPALARPEEDGGRMRAAYADIEERFGLSLAPTGAATVGTSVREVPT